MADLWQLHEWCASTQRGAQDARVLRRLLRLEPDHERARAALGQFGSPGQWFPSREAFERFQRSQQADGAKAKGLVLQGTRWIHRDERARAVEGAEKDFATGQWLSALELRHLREGWARQDLAWIEPVDAPHVDAGLWLVGDDWVDLATADRRHASLDAPWVIPSREVLLRSPEVFARAKSLAGSRLTAGGEIVLAARRFRTQEANRADARARLLALLTEAHDLPEKRAKTRLNRVGKEQRIAGKKLRGVVKAATWRAYFRIRRQRVRDRSARPGVPRP